MRSTDVARADALLAANVALPIGGTVTGGDAAVNGDAALHIGVTDGARRTAAVEATGFVVAERP